MAFAWRITEDGSMAIEEGLGYWTWRILIAVAVVFAMLLVYSLFDLFFLMLGSSGTATVTDVYTIPSRRGSDPVVIEYTYRDRVGERQGKANLGGGAIAPAVGDTIDIQYLPAWFPAGPDGARPTRPFNWIVLGLLALSTVGLGIFIYRAIAASGESTPKRRRRP
jgi:hypothetical protein